MNKYIRTKDGRIAEIKENMLVKVSDDATRLVYKKEPHICVLNGNDDIIKQADTIEELCDEFVVEYKNGERIFHDFCHLKRNHDLYTQPYHNVVGRYGCIWTDKGLLYVAKMNDKGELELI
jgi:hypothetical protein